MESIVLFYRKEDDFLKIEFEENFVKLSEIK
jgi:hypothetical protein